MRFGQRLPHEGDLVHHVLDLGVVRRPVHPVETRGVAAVVDVDLGRGETQVDDLGDELLGLRIVAVVGPRVAVDADAVAHPAAQQLVDRKPQGLARQIPQRDLDRAERGDILAGLRSGEYPGGAQPLEDGVDVQRVLADQREAESRDDGGPAADGIHAFAVADQSLVGVDPHVKRANEGRAHVGDLQLRPPVRRRGGLDSRRQTPQIQQTGQGPGRTLEQRSSVNHGCPRFLKA